MKTQKLGADNKPVKPVEIETQHTGFMLGFGAAAGYRVDFGKWFAMLNLIGGQFNTGVNNSSSSVHIILPTQIKLGRLIGKNLGVYGIVNPLSILYIGTMKQRNFLNPYMPTGFTLGVGATWRFTSFWSLFAEAQTTHEYFNFQTADEKLKFSHKPFYIRALIGLQLSAKPAEA